MLAPVSFSMVNADGEGDYFAGLPAACPAADDIGHELGDAEEASLAEALRYVRTGGCSPSAPASRGLRVRAVGPRPTGWAALVNAR